MYTQEGLVPTSPSWPVGDWPAGVGAGGGILKFMDMLLKRKGSWVVKWWFLGFLLPVACATTPGPWPGPGESSPGTPARYEQGLDTVSNSCGKNPACYTQRGSEAIMLALPRAVGVARGVSAVFRVLESAELARVEQLLVQCAKEADREVNEREYGLGKRPDDAECERVVGYDGKGNKVRRRMELGILKHEVAFACVKRELVRLFPDNVSIEPRYGPDPRTGRYVLTRVWEDSLKPDIVVHFSRDPNRVQCVYDFKFPCSVAGKSNPLANDGTLEQLSRYKKLGRPCTPSIVTPQLGVSHVSPE